MSTHLSLIETNILEVLQLEDTTTKTIRMDCTKNYRPQFGSTRMFSIAMEESYSGEKEAYILKWFIRVLSQL